MIEPEDRVSYAEAQLITGRSRRYLNHQTERGALTRIGGGRRDKYQTWLSRRECETLALHVYRADRQPPYWLTMTQAARLLGMARNSVYQARDTGRLPVWATHAGQLLVRRSDVIALLNTGKVRGRQHLKANPDDTDGQRQPKRQRAVLVHLQPTQGRSRGVEHRAVVSVHPQHPDGGGLAIGARRVRELAGADHDSLEGSYL